MVGETSLTDRQKSQFDDSQSTTKDGSLLDDEAAWKMAEGLGVRIDTCRRIVDTYGAEYVIAGLHDLLRQMKEGKQLRSPVAILVANLKSGAIQVQVANTPNDPHAQNWHAKQSNPTFDTAAKKLARACDFETVRCVCCDQEFPSAV